MNQPIIIIGAGGHSKSLIEALSQNNADIIAAVDINPDKHGTKICGIPVFDKKFIHEYSPDSVLLVNAVGSVCSQTERMEVFLRYKQRGYSFASVIHPNTVIASYVEVGEGAQIMAGAIIQPGTRIGENCIINTKASIDHDCWIGDHVHIAPGVTISGVVSIGSGSHIGCGATIIQGVTINNGSIVGAGATVISDVAAGITVCGVPAKQIAK